MSNAVEFSRRINETGALCPQTQPPLRRSAASQLPSAPTAAAARGHLGRSAAEGSRGPVGARDGGEAAPPLNETASKHKSTSAAALRRVLWTFHHAPSPRRAALKGLLCSAVPHQHSSAGAARAPTFSSRSLTQATCFSMQAYMSGVSPCLSMACRKRKTVIYSEYFIHSKRWERAMTALCCVAYINFSS